MKPINIVYSAFFIFALVFGAPSYAAKPQCEGDLKHSMHDSKEAFKAINQAVDLGDQEALSAAARDLATSLEKAKSHQPTGFSKLPEDKRAQKYAEYKKSLDKSISLAKELQQAQDEAQQETLVAELKKLRKGGHKKYKKCKSNKKDHKKHNHKH